MMKRSNMKTLDIKIKFNPHLLDSDAYHVGITILRTINANGWLGNYNASLFEIEAENWSTLGNATPLKSGVPR